MAASMIRIRRPTGDQSQTREFIRRFPAKVPTRPSPYKMLLDFPYGVFGQVLVDFSDDPRLDIGVKRSPQFRKRARRRRDDQFPNAPSSYKVLQSGGDTLNEAALLDLVPIRSLHGAAAG